MYFHLDNLTIMAKVQATINDKTYQVNVHLKCLGCIDDTQCKCPRG